MKRLFLRILFAAIACTLMCGAVAQTDTVVEFIVIDNNETIYKEVLGEIRKAVNARNIENVKFTSIQDLLQSYHTNELDSCTLLIPIGTDTTKSVVENITDMPVLSLALPKVNYQALSEMRRSTTDSPNKNQFSAVFLDQPLGRRIALLHQILPNAKRISVLLGASTLEMKNELIQTLQEFSYTANIGFFEDQKNLVSVLDDLLDNTDAMLAIADPAVFNAANARNLLLTAYRWRVPMIGLSPAYVRAGALAAVYTTPSQLATQFAETIETIHSCMPNSLPPPQYPKYFEVSVNYKVAEAIGVVVGSEELLRKSLRDAKAVRE